MPIVNSVSGVGLISSLPQKRCVNNFADHKKQVAFTGNKPLSLFQLITSKELSTHNKMFYLKNRINRVFYLINQELTDGAESAISRLADDTIYIDTKTGKTKTFGVVGFIKKTFNNKHK